MSLEDFKNIEDEMHLISSPFACNVDNTPIDVQLDWFTAGVLFLSQGGELSKHEETCSEDVDSFWIYLYM